MNRLLFIVTENYIVHAQSVVFSALEHLPRDFQLEVIFLIDQSLNDDAKQRHDAVMRLFAAEHPSLTWRYLPFAPHIDSDKIQSKYLPSITFYRLFLDQVLDGRVVYMDADLLVNGSIAPLFRWDLAGRAIAGAFDQGVVASIRNWQSIQRQPTRWLKGLVQWWFEKTDRYSATDANATLSQNGLTQAVQYKNAGVLVLDLDRWRALGIGDFVRSLDSMSEYSMADQDVINLIMDKFGQATLDQTYNWQDHRQRPNMAALPVVFHYLSRQKPWLLDLPSKPTRRRRWWDLYGQMLGRKNTVLARDALP